MTKVKDSFACCLYFTSGKFFREISALAEESFMEMGLSPSYAYVLMVVYEEKMVSISEVADQVGLKPSTLTRLADKLVLRNYIERKQEGRNIFLIPTAKLGTDIDQIHACWANLYESYNEILGKEKAERINELLLESNRKF